MSNQSGMPIPSRGHVDRLLRPHLVPLTALAIAADEAASELSSALLRGPSRRGLDSKMRGLWVAALWSEAAAGWVSMSGSPNIELFEPYGWTELIVGNLHVRIQREVRRPLGERRIRRNNQEPDDTLPLFMVDNPDHPVVNIDIVAELADSGRVRGVCATAPLGRGHAWPNIAVDMPAARKQLVSWDRRSVAWLEPIARFREVSGYDDLVDRLRRAEGAVDRAHVADPLSPFLGEADQQRRRPGFRVPPRSKPQTGSDGK